MKILFILMATLLLSYSAAAQVQQLVIENAQFNETHILTDDQMVRVVTTSGKRHKGRMQIVDENTISIQGILIPLNEIDKIKKHSRLVAVLIGAVVVYFSAAAIGIGAIIAILGGELAGGAAISAAGVLGMYGGINGVNLYRSYKRYQGWTYRVAEVPVIAQ